MKIKIPERLFHKIMLYNTHPVADVFKAEYNCMYDDENELSFYIIWLEQYSTRARRNYTNWINQPPINSTDISEDESEVHYFR